MVKSAPDAARVSAHGTARRRFAQRGFDERSADSLERLFDRLTASLRAHDLDDESLFLAEELTRMQAPADATQREALALAVLASMVASGQGSTRLPLGSETDSPLARVIAQILRDAGIETDPYGVVREVRSLAGAPAKATDRILAKAGEYRPLVIADDCLYQQRTLRSEDALVHRLRAHMATAPAADEEPANRAALDEVKRNPAQSDGKAIDLSEEQSQAACRASTRPLTVITGGPGTGKTAIVVSILRLAHRLGTPANQIALAGPTGKAANRMAASIARGLTSLSKREPADDRLLADCPAPQTLHRLLGFAPSTGKFHHHENNPLPASLVVIDESSMIDLGLMDRLLRATPPNARLVLLGDADQLPSVDAGAVFRDLVAALTVQTVRLTKSYRMNPDDPAGSHVLGVAATINAGKSPLPLEPPEGGGVSFVDTGADANAALRLADGWARRRYLDHAGFHELADRTYHFAGGSLADADREALAKLFAHHEESRLLTVTRRFATGSEALNARISRLVATRSPGAGAQSLRPGEPLLMLRNDYDRGLFNGDQGVVARVAEEDAAPRLRALFPRSDRAGGFASFHLDLIRPSIELAYAITVHKSQGSEFGRVAVFLPVADLPLLTREMLYTAVTRARTRVVIVGTASLLAAAAGRAVARFSGVADKLEAGRPFSA